MTFVIGYSNKFKCKVVKARLTEEEKEQNRKYAELRESLIPQAYIHANQLFGDFVAPANETEEQRILRNSNWNLAFHSEMEKLYSQATMKEQVNEVLPNLAV